MQEEIEKEFCAGQHEDCIERQRFLYPKREIGEIHCLILFRRPIRYIRRRKKRRERRKERRKTRKIEKLGEIIVSFLFVRLFVVYVEEDTARERNWGKTLFHCFQPFLFVVYVEKNTARERRWGKSLFHCFIVFSLFCSSYTSKKIR